MTVPKVIDKREAWLDGLSIEAAAVLAKLEKKNTMELHLMKEMKQ